MKRRMMMAMVVAGGMGIGCVMTGCQTAGAERKVAATEPGTRPVEVKGNATNTTGKTAGETSAELNKRMAAEKGVRVMALLELLKAMDQNMGDAQRLQEVVRGIELNTAKQLRDMMVTEEPEAKARVVFLLDYREALSRFVVEALRAPAEERKGLVSWALSPEGAEVVGLTYSQFAERRQEGMRRLGKIDTPEADWLLGRMIDSADREQSLAAMEAVYDRKPSVGIVNALWKKAIINGMAQYGGYGYGFKMRGMPIPRENKVVTIHGRTIQLNEYDPNLQMRIADGEVAVDVMVAYRSPLVEAKLNEFFNDLGQTKVDSNNNYYIQFLSPSYGTVGQNMMRLVEQYHPKAAVRCLVKLISQPASDGWNTNMGQDQVRHSTRIDLLGCLVSLTQQDRSDYKLTRRAEWGNRWMLLGKEEEEEKAMKKLTEWWKKHKGEYE